MVERSPAYWKLRQERKGTIAPPQKEMTIVWIMDSLSHSVLLLKLLNEVGDLIGVDDNVPAGRSENLEIVVVEGAIDD
jgi:hypothetical protein